MSTPTCASCAYWETGACHRRPPWALTQVAPCWPLTAPTDWCGEHALIAPPLTTSTELHLTRELLRAGQELTAAASTLERMSGLSLERIRAHTAAQRALAEAGVRGA